MLRPLNELLMSMIELPNSNKLSLLSILNALKKLKTQSKLHIPCLVLASLAVSNDKLKLIESLFKFRLSTS